MPARLPLSSRTDPRTGGTATRAMVLWCPDWPVTAAIREQSLSADIPLALVDKGEVFACSPAARQEGVRRGLRTREAQARCTELVIQPYDPTLDGRIFEPVIAAIEEIMPGVVLIRPGLCAIRSAGPARYYGGEAQAASILLRTLSSIGLTEARVGIADGPFAAEQAARIVQSTAQPGFPAQQTAQPGFPAQQGPAGDAVRIIVPGGSPEFLRTFPLEVLSCPKLAVLLRRLGIRTLGDFAALKAADVGHRFGTDGLLAHRKASGLDHQNIVGRTPPPQLDVGLDLEPPLSRIDQLAFAFRQSADRFVAGLRSAGLVCTALRVRLHTDSGELSEHLWQHPRWFDADDVLDRVRWQLQGGGSIDHGLSSPIVRVQVAPEIVEDLSDHADGLWGTGPDERIHHGLSRVQSMLGHGAILTAIIAGGRMLVDRRVFIPWGDSPSLPAAAAGKNKDPPWPGRLPGPVPATVFEEPRPVAVLDATGDSVDVDGRGLLTAAPEWFLPPDDGDPRPVSYWGGPWPVEERWWDASGRRLNRFQLVDTTGAAWLLLLEEHHWWAEASYD